MLATPGEWSCARRSRRRAAGNRRNLHRPALAGVTRQQRIERGQDLRLRRCFRDTACSGVGRDGRRRASGCSVRAPCRPARSPPRYGREQPFGQPLMRRLIGASRKPWRSSRTSSLSSEVRQIAFGFGHRQAAGRQRDAGQRVQSQRAGAGGNRPGRIARPAHRCARAAIGRHIGDHQVLVRRQAEFAARGIFAISRRPVRC